MKTLALLLVLTALPAPPPAAAADAFVQGAAQLGVGVVSPDGTTRYVAAPAGSHTTLLAIRTKDGLVAGSADILGSYGIPVLTFNAANNEGLSHDGRTLVLGDTQQLPESHFLVY